MDADDICMPERIAIQVAYLEQHPEIVMCSSDFSAFNSNGVIADSYIRSYYSQVADALGGIAGIYPHREDIFLEGDKITTYSGYLYEEMILGSFVHPPTVLFRRSILKECGLADEHIVNCCDFDWFVRMSRVGKIGFIDRSLLKYRISDNQMSGVGNRVQILLDIVQVIEKNIAIDPELYERKRKLFRRHLGVGYLAVANALVDDDQPFTAIIKLLRSVTFGVLRWGFVLVAIKVVTPQRLIAVLQKLRKSLH